MPIVATDIKYLKTTNNLGGAKTATEVVNNSLGNIFDTFTGDESETGTTVYACIYVENGHGTLTYSDVKQWIQSNTPAAYTDVAIGLGTAAINAQEQTIANETTAPTGVTFSSAANEGTSLTIGDLTAGAYKSLWIRMTLDPASPATASDQFTLRIKGETPA